MLTRSTSLGRIRRNTRGGDAGMTLMELVIAMSLTTIVGAMALTFFVGSERANSKTVDAGVSAASARNVLQSWTNLLSLADSASSPGSDADRFEEITPTEVIFYADLGNRSTTSPSTAASAPSKVWLAIHSGSLVEYIAPKTAGTYPSTPVWHYLTSAADGQKVSASGWLFTPYTVGNPPVDQAGSSLCAGGTAGVCSQTYQSGIAPADTILQTTVRVDIAFTVTTTIGVSQSFTASAAVTGAT